MLRGLLEFFPLSDGVRGIVHNFEDVVVKGFPVVL
jgi:hypothetical protein